MAKKKKKTFRVYAKVISYSYTDVKADSAEEANETVENQLQDEALEGGDFIPCERGGEFILAPDDIPTKEV